MAGELRNQKVTANHKLVEALMRENGLNAVTRQKRNWACLVKARHDKDLPGNILNREFEATRPKEKLASDVTYLPLSNGQWAYLSIVKDLCTAEIVSWAMSKNQDMALAFETLKQLKKEEVDGGIFHTDRGALYTTPSFSEKLKELGLKQSLSKKGNCLDNAVVESFNGTLKCECFYPVYKKKRWDLTFEEASKLVKEYITYYNEERIQKKLGYLTPKAFREQMFPSS